MDKAFLWITICQDVFSDDYSIILGQDETESFGFGIKQIGAGLFKVVDINIRGPAYNNGMMRSDDILIGVNNMTITKITTAEVINELVMKSGDVIKLTLRSRPSKLGKQINSSRP